MSDSAEYKNLKKCTSQLETALEGADSELVHKLHNEGFVNEGTHDEVLRPTSMLTPRQKAGELVKGIKIVVKLDSGSFHKLLSIFREAEGMQYQSITNILETELRGQQGACLPNTQQQARTTNLPAMATTFQQGPQAPGGVQQGPQAPTGGGYSLQQGPQAPTLDDYVACVPVANREALDMAVDHMHGRVDKHLTEIAMVVVDWETRLATWLDLTEVDKHDIKKNNVQDQALQRNGVLKKWKSKFGFNATYRALLGACVQSSELGAAEKIIELLGATRTPSAVQSGTHRPTPSSPYAPPPGNGFAALPGYSSRATVTPLQATNQQPPAQQMQSDLEFSEQMDHLQLSSWLRSKNISEEDCKIIRDNKIPGLAFLKLITNDMWKGFRLSPIGLMMILHHRDEIKRKMEDASQSGGSGVGMTHVSMDVDGEVDVDIDAALSDIDGTTSLKRRNNEVEKIIKEFPPNDVRSLGKELGLHYHTVAAMDNATVHGDMVHKWLLECDNTCEVGGRPPTWRSFAKGLAKQEFWGAVDDIRRNQQKK